MKKVDKNIAMLFLVLLCFIIGGSLSFESLARFSKKFEADKSISTAKFEVNAVNTFDDVENAIPGEEPIAEDKITLSNENDYPVEFTVKLKSENKDESKNLLQFLNLTITIDNEVKEIQDECVIRLEPNTVKDIFAKIEWRLDENGEIDAEVASEATAVYSYDIKAKQLTNDNSGGVNNGGESTEGENSNNGNNGNGSSGTENINTISLKDIDWNINIDGDQNNVEVADNYTIVKGDINIPLDSFKFNLKNENLNFSADIELLNTIDELKKGVNFSIGIKDDNTTNIRNRLTYQLYKDKSVYARVAYTSNVIPPDRISGNGAKVIDTERANLSGEIIEENDSVYAKISILDNKGNEVVGDKTECGNYKINDKLYLDINNIIGEEGIKINSMEVKAVPKE